MRAVCYSRVSSAIQRDRETIASQLRVLPAFVERQGWELVRPASVYVDDGRTAKAGHLDKRTGLALLLHDAALGVFDVVVVIDLDRITRSEDLGERGAILGGLQRAGVRIASAATGQVLDLSTSSGDLFSSLQAFFAAEWSRKHRTRVIEGKITAIQRNRKPSGVCPWGLAYDRASGSWTVDEANAAIVREMFERVAAGESCRAIADDLHRRGISRPRGREWSRGLIARTIRSRYPLGEWTADKQRGLTIAVPPLIDLEIWERAQSAIATSGRRGLRKTRHEYLLEAIAVCGSCGSPIGIRSQVWDPRRNGRHDPAIYRCRSRRDFRIGEPPCRAPTIRVAEADARVWEAIREECEDPELGVRIDRELAGSDAESAAWAADAEGHRLHLERLERVQAGVLDRYRRGLISEDGFDAELARISRDRVAVAEQLRAAERASAAGADVQHRLEDARRTLADIRAVLADSSFAVRRRLLELLVPRGGVVLDGRWIRITMLVPRSAEACARPVLVDSAASSRSRGTHLRIRRVA